MEKSNSPLHKIQQLFKKVKKWMTVDVKQGVIGLGEAVNNNNTYRVDTMPKPSHPIAIRKCQSFNVNYHPKDLDTLDLEFDPSDCYLIDEWEEEEREGDLQATDSSAFKVGSAQGLPEFVFDSPKFSSLSKRNGEVQVIKFSVKSSSSKSRRLKSRRRSKSLDDCIKVALSQYIEKQYYFNCLDLLLYARFYLEDETTMIVPILAIGEASSRLNQGVDYKLMEMSIHYLFKIQNFNLKSFLDSGVFDHYGQCQCFQIGYSSKIVVLSFDRGYNITYNKEDMLRWNHVF
jgi:hypothetical protein